MGETEIKTNKKKASRLWILLPALALVLLAGYGGQELGWWRPGPAASPTAEPTPSPTAEPTPSPTPAPLFAAQPGYIFCIDGMFYPEAGLTRAEAEAALESAGRAAPPAEDEAEILTEDALAELVAAAADRRTAEEAMDSIRGLGDEIVTRAEAAVFFNRLFGLEGTAEETSYFPDVAPDYWAWADIQTAAVSGYYWPGENGRLEPGFMMLDGYLYYAGEDGYLYKNEYVGSLLFENTGRYTSGSRELDDYVAEVLRAVTVDTMTREEMLYAAYEYVRDSFSYLVRNYYRIGDVGWQLEEALTMYSTGRGNCYCYAAAFWAAARQLGYDAKIVSGTYGPTRAPHGWVEIQQNGERYTYDVEIEMVSLLPGHRWQNLFAMNDIARMAHGYVESVITDNLVPRETNSGLLPQ